MKVSEVRKGEVRLAEKRIAHADSGPAVSKGPGRAKSDGPDFTEYLSEKDRRRWDRLSDSKQERILRKAERSATVREYVQQPEEAGQIQEYRAVPGEGFSRWGRTERQAIAECRENRGNKPVITDALIGSDAGRDISGYESENGTVNIMEAVSVTGSGKRRTGTRSGIHTGGSGPSVRNGSFTEGSRFSGKENRRASAGREYSGNLRSLSGMRTGSIGSPFSGAGRIKSRMTAESRINTPSAGPGGIAGFAASAARKTASKVSGALREKAEQISAGDAAKNLEDFEKAADEVKKVMAPIRRIVGAILALLSLILGPIIFAIIMIVILVVVIIFLVAWLISVLIPVVTANAASFPMTGYGNMPYYCQQDERWGAYPYDAGTISSYGCGPTSMAMILACLTGDYSIIPTTIAELGNQNIGVYGLSVGGTHAAPDNLAALYNIEPTEQMAGPSQNCCGVSRGFDLDYIKQKIGEGCPILVSVTGSYCNVSTDGHYLVLYGQGENGVYLYDPATLGRLYQESIDNGGTDWNSCLHDAKHIWIFPAAEIRIEGNTNAERIFNYLVNAGWSEAAAAGAVGNFYQEAGGGGTADINPASYDSGSWGEAGGIAGFTDNGDAGNFTALKNFASQRGKDWTDLPTQCEFMIYQLTHGKWWGAYDTPTYTQMMNQGYSVQHMTYEEFTQLTDVNEAVKAFLCFYEDCGYRMAHYEDVRLPMARQAYSAWGSGINTGGSSEKKK